MLSNSQKEHLTYTVVGQVVILAGLALVAYQYIFPGLTEAKNTARAAQESIDTYSMARTEGIATASLQWLLSSRPERAELVKIIQSDSAGAQSIMRKPESAKDREYLDWLKSAIGATDEEKKDLIKEKAKLNSIIPTMSPFSNNIEENNISLKQYVAYIEKTILKEFNFDSNVIIGMQGMTFADGKGNAGVPESIGMFDFRLDFKATNADILRFIEYINASWEPSILSQTGVLSSSNVPEAMSNPLITMEMLAVQERLDSDNPTKENSGRATLRFYVRGVAKDDIKFLKESLKARQVELEKRVADAIKECEKDGPVCTHKRKLVSFQTKYQEYIRSLGSAKTTGIGGPDEIYVLTQSANTLQSLETELEEVLPKAKINNN
jgi:hypothetical protein